MTKEALKSIILEVLSDITGLEPEELKDYEEINLFESGILDSLSIAALFTEMQNKVDKKISFQDFKIENLSTISLMTDAFYECDINNTR